jgi:hypothetical protein
MPPRASRSVLGLLVLTLVALLAAGCRAERLSAVEEFAQRERPLSGPARGYLLGFSEVPARLSTEALVEAYELAAHYGEVLLVQRPVSWAEFLPGATVSSKVEEDLVAVRESTRARGLQTVLALDPFDAGSRGRLLGLPSAYTGRTLADPALRAAFVAQAAYIARTVEPAYLVLGTEVNATFERNPEAYTAFVDAYHEAYEAVKAIRPETQVLVSFQYEELLGVVPELPPHAPRWELLEHFEGVLDAIGVTSYPSFAYPTARKVPLDYYHQLRERTDLPVVFVAVGYSSSQARDGLNSSTPPEQRRFLQRLLEDAERLGAPVVIWFAGRDPGFATSPPYDLLAHIGLRTALNQPKEAWPVWEAASNQPYDRAAAEAARLAREAFENAEAATPTPEPEEESVDEDQAGQ